MKLTKIIYTFFICVFLQFNANAKPTQTSKAINFVHQVLPSSKTISVDVLDNMKMSKRHRQLLIKFMTSVQNDKEWFFEQVNNAPEGKPLPYHPKFGLTEKEYEEFLASSKQFELVSLGKQNLEIVKNSQTITFLGKDKLSAFNDLVIDLPSHSITYLDKKLPDGKEIIVTDENNALKSTWKGFFWQKLEKANPTKAELKNMNVDTIEIEIIRFTIGKLDKNGKIFMNIEHIAVANGEEISKIDLPILFEK